MEKNSSAVLQRILTNQELIISELREINETLKIATLQTEKMGNHIDFVEKAAKVVKGSLSKLRFVVPQSLTDLIDDRPDPVPLSLPEIEKLLPEDPDVHCDQLEVQ